MRNYASLELRTARNLTECVREFLSVKCGTTALSQRAVQRTAEAVPTMKMPLRKLTPDSFTAEDSASVMRRSRF